MFDHGVYRLHEMTTSSARSVGSRRWAPSRSQRRDSRRSEGRRTIDVTTQDHVLIHLEFASGVLGQLLSSFATADSLAPWLELHLEHGVMSFGGKSWEPEARSGQEAPWRLGSAVWQLRRTCPWRTAS